MALHDPPYLVIFVKDTAKMSEHLEEMYEDHYRLTDSSYFVRTSDSQTEIAFKMGMHKATPIHPDHEGTTGIVVSMASTGYYGFLDKKYWDFLKGLEPEKDEAGED